MNAQTFHVGDVLTAMTGRLVSPSGVDGIYRILDHLTGESLMTHQLPRASREAEPILRERFPDLAAIEIPEFKATDGGSVKDAVFAWIDTIVAEYGETREVEPLPVDDHTRIDPLAELRMMRPDMPIIAVHLSDEDES